MKKRRQSSFEMLRILAMLLIVSEHFLGQSGILGAHADSLGMQLCGSGARWACNLFLIVGCWFLVDASFSAKRILSLYLTVLMYTAPLTIIALACGAHPSLKDIMRGFLPFTGRALWFASAYISLMLLAPWLRRAFELSRRSLGLLVALLTFLISGVCTLPDAQMCYTIDFCWFIYVFICIGYLKEVWRDWCGSFLRHGWIKWLCLLVGLSIYAVMILMRTQGSGFVASWAGQCLADFKTLPNFVSAILVFAFFLMLDIGSIGVVNWFASGAFAVYAIHQTPAFFDFLWMDVLRVGVWKHSPRCALYALGVVLGVYLIGSGCEYVRRVTIRKVMAHLGTLSNVR